MIIEAIKKRRAIRAYKPDTIEEEKIIEIIKAAQFAPTAHDTRAVEFIIIKDQTMKEKIFDIVGQEYVKEAPVVIAPVTDPEKSALPVQDISVATAFIFLQAAFSGLGTVWKNISPEWEEGVKNLLGVPKNFRMINLIPIGYSAEAPEMHDDAEFSKEKIHQEKW